MMMKISVMGRGLMTLSLALAAGSLGGCGRSEPAPEDVQTNETMEMPAETTANISIVPPPPPAMPDNVTPPPPVAPKVDPGEEQQMHDDADATGLTARVNRDEEQPVETGGNETQH